MGVWGPLLEGETYTFQKIEKDGAELTLKIERKLGQGGFGVVYLVYIDGQKYALKCLGVRCDIDNEEIFKEFLAGIQY